MFIDLVLSGPVSQRAAASVLRLFVEHLGWNGQRLPCANSGRLWIIRVGLYALTSPKPEADDWLWMMDHTVQLGPWKCLVIVGIRLSHWRSLDRPLRHEDLELLNVTPMVTANGEAVAEQLKQTTSQTGLPVAVLSDEGAELKSGMSLFTEQLPEDTTVPEDTTAVPHLHDIKHKAAILLKKQLGASDQWEQFVKQLTRTRLKVSLTSLAFLNPPRLRNKARFMNLQDIVTWGIKVLRFLEDRPAIAPEAGDQPKALDAEQLEAKLGWLRGFDNSLRQWAELLSVIEAAEKYVRVEGYHKRAKEELAERLRPLATQPSGQELMHDLLAFVQQESDKLGKDKRILGHTEILESLLGKYKQTQARHSQGGMTASLLNIGAAVCSRTPEVIRQALSATPVSAVNEWVKESLGQTIASKRKHALGSQAVPTEQNRPENESASLAPI